MFNKIIFWIGIVIYSILNVIASSYFRTGQIKKESFTHIFLLSITIGIISYFVKIPVLYFCSGDMSIMIINIIITVSIFIGSVFYSQIILKEKINYYTYIIIFLIVLLILLNDWLNYIFSKKNIK
jgi:hypothetical protein